MCLPNKGSIPLKSPFTVLFLKKTKSKSPAARHGNRHPYNPGLISKPWQHQSTHGSLQTKGLSQSSLPVKDSRCLIHPRYKNTCIPGSQGKNTVMPHPPFMPSWGQPLDHFFFIDRRRRLEWKQFNGMVKIPSVHESLQYFISQSISCGKACFQTRSHAHSFPQSTVTTVLPSFSKTPWKP